MHKFAWGYNLNCKTSVSRTRARICLRHFLAVRTTFITTLSYYCIHIKHLGFSIRANWRVIVTNSSSLRLWTTSKNRIEEWMVSERIILDKWCLLWVWKCLGINNLRIPQFLRDCQVVCTCWHLLWRRKWCSTCESMVVDSGKKVSDICKIRYTNNLHNLHNLGTRLAYDNNSPTLSDNYYQLRPQLGFTRSHWLGLRVFC